MLWAGELCIAAITSQALIISFRKILTVRVRMMKALLVMPQRLNHQASTLSIVFTERISPIT
ncbi:hypothetical protein BA950_07650 [Erythrobacter sp. SAORIC-644]|nr:hypothetical protein BA950_07650 [Erythrobacter sp. SAORIC-644]